MVFPELPLFRRLRLTYVEPEAEPPAILRGKSCGGLKDAVNFWKAGSSGKFTMRHQTSRGPATSSAPVVRIPFDLPLDHRPRLQLS